MTDIDALSAAAYRGGTDPIDWAVDIASTAIGVRDEVAQIPRRGTGALVGWADISDDAVARKIVASLLDAGWRPPSDEDRQAAADQAQCHRDRFRTWWGSLTQQEQQRAGEHYDHTCEWPADVKPPTEAAS